MSPDRPRHSAFAALLGIVAVAVVAGVIVTVGVAPAIALTGVASGNSIGLFEDLPSDLTVPKLDQRTEIYALAGKKSDKTVRIAQFFDQNREVIGWDDVTANVKNTTLAAEDVRFYEHGAIDPTGVLRAIVTDATGGEVSGASTITQQLVKNVCVQEAEKLGTQKAIESAYNTCTAGDIGRKIAEARYAIGLEQKYSKNDILLNYLNIAGFGGNIYGIQAAAQYYFDVDEQDLTIAQAASLIAIVNNPSYLQLDKKSNLAANTVRRNYILGVELKYKMITAGQYETAITTVTKPKITPLANGCNQAGVSGFFCDYVTQIIQTDSHFGATPTERYDNLYSKGWKIYTTLNVDLEKKAQSVMNAYVPKHMSGLNIGGAAVSVGVGTGNIVTMVQNKHYDVSGGNDSSTTALNYNVDKQYNGGGGIQPGSTYKMFTLVDWLEKGHSLYDVVSGDQRVIQPSSFTACGKPYDGAPWSVSDDEGASENGPTTVIHATERSINGAFASMAEQLDLCDIRTTAQNFLVHNSNGSELDDVAPSVIGGSDNLVAPLTMATAYAAIGNGGQVCTPVAITKVVQTDGEPLPVPTTKCTQATSKVVATAAAEALHTVFTGGGTAGTDSTADGVYEVGKTGTTDGNANTWTVGTSNTIATAVWVGQVSGYNDLRAVYDTPYCPVVGSTQAALERHCVWHGIQTLENEYYGGSTASFGTPDSTLVYGAAHTVPNVVGDSEATAESTLVANGFSWAIGGTVASDSVAKGLVASTNPPVGATASGHVEVTLQLSSGPSATPASATVPGVVGQPVAGAKSALTSAGFTNVTTTYVQGTGACTVESMNPAGGTSTAASTPVTLTVAAQATATNGSFQGSCG